MSVKNVLQTNNLWVREYTDNLWVREYTDKLSYFQSKADHDVCWVCIYGGNCPEWVCDICNAELDNDEYFKEEIK